MTWKCLMRVERTFSRGWESHLKNIKMFNSYKSRTIDATNMNHNPYTVFKHVFNICTVNKITIFTNYLIVHKIACARIRNILLIYIRMT